MKGKKAAHHLFYADPVSGKIVTLDREETHHARSVLRIAPGDAISVTDGAGHVARCRLTGFTGKTAEAAVLETQYHNPPAPALQALVGMPQKSAFEDVLKSLAALGVTAVTPVDCLHAGKRWWATRWQQHSQRFHRTIIAAAKQSLNPHFMSLKDPAPFQTALGGARSGSIFYADEEGCALHELMHRTGPITIGDTLACFIGPPGGFSRDEIAMLRQSKAIPVRLSEFRLRTELAAVVACGCLVNAFRL